MSVNIIGKVIGYSIREYIGESTDTKPIDVNAGCTFFELDTGNVFMYDGTTWRVL